MLQKYWSVSDSGHRLGIPIGRCINRQRGRVQILFLILFFLFFYFLPSGGGSVPFVHPRKYGEEAERLENERSSYIQQSSFSNLSVSSPTSQLILQPFRRFTYVTALSPTVPLLHQRHSSFSNPSFASPTSQALHLRHLARRPCYEYSSNLLCSRTRKVFTTLPIPAVAFKETTNSPSPHLLPSNIFAGRFS